MTASPETAPLAAGPFAPPTHGVGLDQPFFSLDAQAGRPLLLLFVGRLTPAETREAWSECARGCAAAGVDGVALIEIDCVQDYLDAPPGLRVVASQPEVFAAWGFTNRRPALVGLDRAGRVVETPFYAGPASLATLLGALVARPHEAVFDDLMPAPVLVVPDILSAATCRDLIAHFEASKPAFGGMASVDAQGAAVHKVDAGKKHRFDLVLGPQDPFLNLVLAGVASRVTPEIAKAFHVDIRHTDRLLLARYDDSGGYFKRHRDNAAPAVAFRQFALSLNLNDDYDGGHVLFPEYNDRRYRPPAGAGVVFSCSLLHEAAPVTRGRRYCALTFLHDAAAQARWLQAGRRAS